MSLHDAAPFQTWRPSSDRLNITPTAAGPLAHGSLLLPDLSEPEVVAGELTTSLMHQHTGTR